MYPTEPFWNEKFKDESYFYGLEANRFLKEHSSVFKAGAEILSLGDGEGRNAVFLAREGYNLTASDASARALEKLDKLAADSGVKVSSRYEDIVTGSWDLEKWDAIINIFCHLPREERVMVYEKIRASLNPGGIFLTEMFAKEQLNYKSGGPPDPEMLLNIEELSEFFAGYKIIYARAELTELNEGRHLGTAAVVRFIGQKP